MFKLAYTARSTFKQHSVIKIWQFIGGPPPMVQLAQWIIWPWAQCRQGGGGHSIADACNVALSADFTMWQDFTSELCFRM